MTSNALVQARETFEGQLTKPEMKEKITNFLPEGVKFEKFQQVVIRSITEKPDLLTKDRTSLLIACSNAAQDGLLPDGRDGALVVYKGRVQWQPMVGGLRKLLAQAGFTVRARVVYSEDHFDFQEGDSQFIDHKPPKLGTDRGDIVGAYAIATGPDGKTYQRVLDKADIDKVKAVSRAANGPWKFWYEQMAEKTVVKRLIQELPVDSSKEGMERLAKMVERDNKREFNFGSGHEPTEKASSIQDKIRKLHPEPRNKPEPIDPEPAADPNVIEGELASEPDPF